jgi:hypothetical protein
MHTFGQHRRTAGQHGGHELGQGNREVARQCGMDDDFRSGVGCHEAIRSRQGMRTAGAG